MARPRAVVAALALSAVSFLPVASADPVAVGILGWTLGGEIVPAGEFLVETTFTVDSDEHGVHLWATPKLLDVDPLCSRNYYNVKADAEAKGYEAKTEQRLGQGCPTNVLCIPGMCIWLPAYVPTWAYCSVSSGSATWVCAKFP